MKLIYVLVALVLGGCEVKQAEYHFACYTYQDESDQDESEHFVTKIEYPCKVTQSERVTEWRERKAGKTGDHGAIRWREVHP